MRKSVNISEETLEMIEELRKLKFDNSRITKSFIISTSLLSSKLEENLKNLKATEKKYESRKYTLSYKAESILNENMKKGFSADSVIQAAISSEIKLCKDEEKLKMYKNRYNFIKNNHCEFKGIELIQYLPLIYAVFLVNKEIPEQKYCIYSGKSLLFADRLNDHVISVIDNPEYFGLTEDELHNPNLSISFEIIEELDISNISTLDELLKLLAEKERASIEKLKPITQQGMNMINDNKCKRERVKEVLDKIKISIK